MRYKETYKTRGIVTKIFPPVRIEIEEGIFSERRDFEIKRPWRKYFTGEGFYNYLHFTCFPTMFKKLLEIKEGDEVEVEFCVYGYERDSSIYGIRVFNWLYTTDIIKCADTSFSIDEWRKRQAEMTD